MSEWLPIETAPKDGTHVALFGKQTEGEAPVRFKGAFVTSGYWDAIDEAWCMTGASWQGPFFDPWLWMPLPPPPERRS